MTLNYVCCVCISCNSNDGSTVAVLMRREEIDIFVLFHTLCEIGRGM